MQTTPTLSEFSARIVDFICRADVASIEPDPEFESLALELFALQFAEIPVYGRFCKARGVTPDRIADWRDIPPLPTRAFKEFELSRLASERRTRVFLSSGTTPMERRSHHFHSEDTLAVYEASIVPWFGRHLLSMAPEPSTSQTETGLARSKPLGRTDLRITPGLSLLALTPTAQLAPQSSLVHMLETVRKAFEFTEAAFTGIVNHDGTWSLDLPRTQTRLRECVEASQRVLLVGTAYSFVHLLDHLSGCGERFHLPAGSRVMETGGYKGRSRVLARAELHAHLSKTLGVVPQEIVTEYGMTELSSQAYDRVAGTSMQHSPSSFRFPPWARAQVVSPESGLEAAVGETGLVRVFDLANVGSVLAVQTEDLALRNSDGFEVLGRAPEAERRGCSLMLR